MIRSSVLSAEEGLKAMSIAITEVAGGLSHCPGDRPRFRKYDNVDQNKFRSDDPEMYDEVSKMII